MKRNEEMEETEAEFDKGGLASSSKLQLITLDSLVVIRVTQTPIHSQKQTKQLAIIIMLLNLLLLCTYSECCFCCYCYFSTPVVAAKERESRLIHNHHQDEQNSRSSSSSDSGPKNIWIYFIIFLILLSLLLLLLSPLLVILFFHIIIICNSLLRFTLHRYFSLIFSEATKIIFKKIIRKRERVEDQLNTNSGPLNVNR